MGFSPKPRGGWIITTTFPNLRDASTMSSPSTYREPGGSPHASVIASLNSGSSVANQAR